MNELQQQLFRILNLDKTRQEDINKRLDDLIYENGLKHVMKWRNMSKQKNSLLHELVDRELAEVIRHVVQVHKFDINVRRDTDGKTPLQLAQASVDGMDVVEVLKELGAKDILTEDVRTWLSDDDKENAMNIVWVDLEMTSIEEPEILECAVIITDKDLKEIAQGNSYESFSCKAKKSDEEMIMKMFSISKVVG